MTTEVTRNWAPCYLQRQQRMADKFTPLLSYISTPLKNQRNKRVHIKLLFDKAHMGPSEIFRNWLSVFKYSYFMLINRLLLQSSRCGKDSAMANFVRHPGFTNSIILHYLATVTFVHIHGFLHVREFLKKSIRSLCFMPFTPPYHSQTFCRGIIDDDEAHALNELLWNWNLRLCLSVSLSRVPLVCHCTHCSNALNQPDTWVNGIHGVYTARCHWKIVFWMNTYNRFSVMEEKNFPSGSRSVWGSW